MLLTFLLAALIDRWYQSKQLANVYWKLSSLLFYPKMFTFDPSDGNGVSKLLGDIMVAFCTFLKKKEKKENPIIYHKRTQDNCFQFTIPVFGLQYTELSFHIK